MRGATPIDAGPAGRAPDGAGGSDEAEPATPAGQGEAGRDAADDGPGRARSETDDPGTARGSDGGSGEGGFEVGYDERFEDRWWRWSRFGQGAMVLVLLLALSGLLGRGPLSHHSLSSADGTLTVDFEPVARYGTPTQITLRVAEARLVPAPGGGEEVRLALSDTAAAPLGLQRTIPQPIRWSAGGGRIEMQVAAVPDAAEQRIRLQAQPSAAGWVSLWARVGGQEVTWHQLVLP